LKTVPIYSVDSPKTIPYGALSTISEGELTSSNCSIE
jgi:hypothetical protein